MIMNNKEQVKNILIDKSKLRELSISDLSEMKKIIHLQTWNDQIFDVKNNPDIMTIIKIINVEITNRIESIFEIQPTNQE